MLLANPNDAFSAQLISDPDLIVIELVLEA